MPAVALRGPTRRSLAQGDRRQDQRQAVAAAAGGVGFERLVHGGLVVQDTSCQGIPFGLRVLGGCLETAAMLGDHAIRTHGATVSMTLKLALPETVMAALPGQPLDRLVSHPLLDGASCVLTEVTGAGRRPPRCASRSSRCAGGCCGRERPARRAEAGRRRTWYRP